MAKRTPASASTVILEISPRAAKLMVATGPGEIERLSCATIPESEQSEDQLAALRRLLETQSPGVRRVGLLFGREVVTLRTLELPATDPNEIASMLELQLGKLTPYPRAEILSGWTLIGSFRAGYTRILLAIARKPLIDAALRLLDTKGLSAQWVGVSSEGLAAWGAAQATPAEEPGGPLTALIDVDLASTDCAIISEGRLLFSHSLTIGAEQLRASEQGMLRWLGELVRLPRILLHEDISGALGRGVLTGLTQGFESLAEQLKAQWGVPVELREAGAPAGAVSQPAQATAVSYTALIGRAASAEPPRIDLLPPEARVSQALQVRSRHLARLAAGLAVLLVLAAVLYIERIMILRGYFEQLQARLSVLERTSERVMADRERMRAVQAWLAPSESALEVFRAVAASVDPEITITHLTFSERRPVRIRGTAQSMPAAFAFFDRLKAGGPFVNVHARSVAKARGADEAGATFEIVCEWQES